MSETTIKAERRTGTGKSVTRKLRKEGRIPAVVYGRDTEPAAVTIVARDWEKLMRHARRNVILTMELASDDRAETRPVMVKEVQKSILGDAVLHIDFLQVSMERMIEVEIPVEFVGTPKGVADNGIVEQHLRTIMVECLPTDIPEKIAIDISDLDIGDSYHVNQISIPGVKVLEHGDVAIVTVTPPATEEKAGAGEEEQKKEE